MTIDPRWSFFLSLFISILNFLAGSTTQFVTLGLSQMTINMILAIVVLVTGVLSLVNTALSALPSSKPTDPNEAKKFYLGPSADAPPSH